MKFLAFLSLLFFAHASFAAITLTSNPTGISFYDYNETSKETTLYAGLGGIELGACASDAQTGLCNTCKYCKTACTTPGGAGCCGNTSCCVCNETAVHDGTVLTINFRSSTVLTGLPKLALETESRDTPSTGSSGSGGNFSFTTTWDKVCQVISGTANCISVTAPSTPVTLQLSVSDGTTEDTASLKFVISRPTTATSMDGTSARAGSLVFFTTYPGDEKVYMENVKGAGNFTGESGAVKYIRVYASKDNFANAYMDSGYTPADLSVDSNGDLDQIIDGLENDVTFHFRAASVDQAGNIFNVMDDAAISSSTDPETGQTSTCEVATNYNTLDPSIPADATKLTSCRFQATPSRVLGLLTEDMNCFVATAAYGTQMDHHLKTFREFRFKVLLPSKLGRKLNYAYYNYGPKAARFIATHEWARTTSRVLLWPAWGVAKLSLHWNLSLVQTLALLFSSIGMGAFLLLYGLKQGLRRWT